ncbi:glycerophosphodiester phosphodiesterase [Psychrobacter sp. F1192]|uniref:Glycerophosphodiester phosphodiesterase n=1 Tax=Psychrobacter coccoides TaxID=2818440 RepID=A0ABS3NR58_9GAMM|nr:glycerophosphodiester phosphodiesterase [Psychrobacter coccoides]MBO1531911.1 glycerophosphodiester phosphodiesterase [Psychrobacter coccoides]
MIKLGNTQLLGHRGARNEALENTLHGFYHAQSLYPRGLAGVELDVQLTADEHLIVFHDDTLQRLCRLQSRIDQLNLAEIRRHLQFGHPIITLDMLASVLSSGDRDLPAQAPPPLSKFTHIELEIKTHDRTNHSKLIQALMRYLIDTPLASLPIVLTTFDTQLLARLQRHQYLTLIPRGLLVRNPDLLISAPNRALQLGCIQLGVYYPLLTEAIIYHAHRYGLSVSAWTVNDIKAIKQLVKWQVDFIITDIPTQVLSPIL